MVRRWSYINSLNCNQLLISRNIPKVSVDANLNTLMYLKKRYALATKLTRRQWARRKHLHNWIAPLNVLKDWAKSYRFYRNVSKLVYFQFFTKNSFIAFNLVSARNSIPALYKGSESILTGSYSKRVLRLLTVYPNSRCKFFTNFGYTRVLAISLHSSMTSTQIVDFFDSQSSVVPLYYDTLTSLTSWDTVTTSAASIINLFKRLSLTHFNLFLAQLIALYKSLLLLTINRV